MSQILLAGGAGFIGSHTAVELLDAGYEVIIADNLMNSSAKSITLLLLTSTVIKQLSQNDTKLLTNVS